MKTKKIWQYTFSPTRETHEGRAHIMLREDGFFAAVSDYGNYAYLWTHHGHKDFREFFLRTDWHYVAKKLGPEEKLDPAASFARIKRYVCEMRHEHEYTKEQARARWEQIERFSGDEAWEAFLYSGTTHELFDEPWQFGVMRMSAQVEAFARQIVCNRLQKAIEAELQSEAAPLNASLSP